MTAVELKETRESPKTQLTSGIPILPATTASHSPCMMVTQKTNHVSTVLLYGIPIVSLYIESQERLCLAQISNTLLKAYSYNEIHNRRVALGITCVQCTPVQLEILRRAGAMPVSSRRCGMITRREAERLCKSFLGDNSPPRLPEDFAFNVQHKCAWGCRGAFLPSRYNSSRAKCIKCTFCGMFFSPNKFIFHSHRMSASDKYVQPDAANFNSWRRHMFLSGQPQEEVIHAWEDVKAMFNGGTRKRLLHSSGSAVCSTREQNAATDLLVNAAKEDALVPTKRPRKASGTGSNNQEEDISTNISLSSSETNDSLRSTIMLPQRFQQLQSDTASTIGVPALQISRFAPHLMVDYMFQTQQQQQKIKNASHCAQFSFPNFTPLPWLKAPPCSTQFKCLPANELNAKSTSTTTFFSPNDYTAPSILSTSAFKPVLQQNLQKGKPLINTVAAAATFVSSSMYTCDASATSPTNQPNNANSQSASLAFTTFTPSSRLVFPTTVVVRGQTYPSLNAVKDQPFSDDDENATDCATQHKNNEDEDEIEVDIETTEDEPQFQSFNYSKTTHSEQLHAQNDDGGAEIDTDNTDCGLVFNSLYKSRSFTELSNAEKAHLHLRCSPSPRSRQCSCSSSNDSLYMSAHTKSEKESSSRATSTASIEIHNDEIPKPADVHHSLLKEPGSRKAQSILSNVVINELPMKTPKLTAAESTKTNADNELNGDAGKVINNAVALFDKYNNANSNTHILTNISNHNKTCNTYNHDLWQVASLCLHRPQLPHNLSNSTCYNRH